MRTPEKKPRWRRLKGLEISRKKQNAVGISKSHPSELHLRKIEKTTFACTFDSLIFFWSERGFDLFWLTFLVVEACHVFAHREGERGGGIF